MKKYARNIQSFFCFLLTVAILLSGTAIPIYAQQDKPIVISFGQPNIWSLEQAHYLLARMHRQNLDLQTAALCDLDPNAANASRIEILRTLLEISEKFAAKSVSSGLILSGWRESNHDAICSLRRGCILWLRGLH